MSIMDNCCECGVGFRFKCAEIIKWWGGVQIYDSGTLSTPDYAAGYLLGRGRLPQLNRYLTETLRVEGPDGVDALQWKQRINFYGKDGPTSFAGPAGPARQQLSDSINGVYYDQGYDDDGTLYDIDTTGDMGFVAWDFLWDLIPSHDPGNVTRTVTTASETASEARWDDSGLSGHPADYIIYKQNLSDIYTQDDLIADITSYHAAAYDLTDDALAYLIDGTSRPIDWGEEIFAWKKWPTDTGDPYNFATGPPDFDDRNVTSSSDPLSNFSASVNYYPTGFDTFVTTASGPTYGMRPLAKAHTHGQLTGNHALRSALVETSHFACKARDCYICWDDSGSNDDVTLDDSSCVPEYFSKGKFIMHGEDDSIEFITDVEDPPVPDATCTSQFFLAKIPSTDLTQADCCVPPP